ncbi:MAG: hypothetical protein ACOY40_00010 [Bacillota bacterium]
MLEKGYTIPVMLGICLGLIMAGVQISATALNAAVGHQRDISLVVVDNIDRNGISGQVLGKKFDISLPLPGDTGEADLAAPERAREIYRQCREKVYPAGAEVYTGLERSAREAAKELNERWRTLIH